ncbi:diaminopimelate epimerase [Streptomyces alkaliphilus]|uniref:Diaminopimelate epimerase n=1 Tax=Streptomyces alkaliphilus TaxID=1472722 RepID=A0A7W3TEZ1_9ACTN|nr:diaminopimelate epimerase [Streptomyces alkaliphilus]MBB0245601.1 diaminopimelate epimerase [Streptomyces alkaliphilus]
MSSAPRPVPFLKGHGTENDFVIIPDHDGLLDLPPAAVARLCDRRAGIGGDGLLRVVRSAAIEEGRSLADTAEWFMDYRNADGSVAEMCGNGVRVFARYLLRAGLVKEGLVPVATRAGVRRVHLTADGDPTVEMGRARLPGGPDETITVTVGERVRPGRWIDMGNPHAVVFVDDLADAGPLTEPPAVAPASVYPDGVNVEFVVDRGPAHVAMRVHERGSGETRSCGTGACAVMVATARRDGRTPEPGAPLRYTVDLPGGSLVITEDADGGITMTGPAEIVAEGVLDADWWARSRPAPADTGSAGPGTGA